MVSALYSGSDGSGLSPGRGTALCSWPGGGHSPIWPIRGRAAG